MLYLFSFISFTGVNVEVRRRTIFRRTPLGLNRFFLGSMFSCFASRAHATLGDERLRFLQLAVGVLCATNVGTESLFGLLSTRMKSQFQLDQSALTTVSTVGQLSLYLTFPVGIAFDRYGPKPIILLGTLLLVLGYLGYSMILAGILPGNVGTLSLCCGISMWSAGWFDTGTTLTNLFNFPLNRGDVVMIQKTFMGLGAAFFSVVYASFFQGQIAAFCIFVACFALIAGGLATLFVDLPEDQRRKLRELPRLFRLCFSKTAPSVGTALLKAPATPKAMKVGQLILLLNVVYLIGTSLLMALVVVPTAIRSVIGCVAILLLFSFIAVPWFAAVDKPTISDVPTSGTALTVPTLTPAAPDITSSENFTSADPESNTRFISSLRSLDVWLLWFNSFVQWGSCATVLLNSAQIYRSVDPAGFNLSTNALYVAVGGIGSAVGRIVAGFLEKRWKGQEASRLANGNERGLGPSTPGPEGDTSSGDQSKPITALLPFPPLLSCFALLSFTAVGPAFLFFPFFVNQLAYGLTWATTILSCRLMYPHSTGTHYNFLFTGGMVGVILLNRVLFGTLYDNEATQQGRFPHCDGARCFRVAFWIMAALNLISACLLLFLHRRWMSRTSRLSPG